LEAHIALLAGVFRLSREQVRQVVSDVFGIPSSKGTIDNTLARINAILADPWAELRDAVRKAEAVHLDETTWRLRGAQQWLWVAASALHACYRIDPSRSQQAAKALIGEDFGGFAITDRYVGYHFLDVLQQQLCWAHVIRQLIEISERGGATGRRGQKLVALARDAIPGITRLGLLLNPTSPIAPGARAQVTAAASATGLALTIAEAATREELEAALTALAATQALVVSPNGFFVAQAPRLYAWQMAARVPLIAATRGNGEMVNYGVDPAENFRRAATYVDKILKGARPGDLPIEFPTKVLLEVNLKVAKALGLAIPPQLLARADEVIE